MRHYLSLYLTPPGRAALVAPRHDQAVALWRVDAARIDLLRYWELERLTGQKHHYYPLFGVAAIEELLCELLGEEGLSIADVSATWGTPGLALHRDIPSPAGAEGYSQHALAHLFSSLLLDAETFRTSTILAMAVDGAPDVALEARNPAHWYVGAVAREGSIMYAPVESPAPLYGAARHLFHLEPGTLMALATACEASIEYDVPRAIEALDLFGGVEHPHTITVPYVKALYEQVSARFACGPVDNRFTLEENVVSAVMKIVQACGEGIMERNVTRLCRQAGAAPSDAYLALSGGFALNCPSNSHLLNKYGFKGLLAPPAANDGGQALGIGLLGLYSCGAFATARFALGNAFKGRLPRAEEALTTFANDIESVTTYSEATFIRDLTTEPVAWVDGGSEIGPRALGHRCLLGDPTQLATKQTLNRWKGRQWWRPVAPVVLSDEASRWFAIDRASPYMLEVAAVREAFRERVAAVVHLDGTARLQTLSAADDSKLYGAVSAFYRATGIPMLCNTSLNDKGEPIVDSAAEALSFCLRKGVRVAYVEGWRIALKNRAASGRHERPPLRMGAKWFCGPAQAATAWTQWLSDGLSLEAVFLISRFPELRSAMHQESDVEMVNERAHRLCLSDTSFGSAVDRFIRLYGPTSAFTPSAGARSNDESRLDRASHDGDG